MGDLLQTTPLLAGLKEQDKEAEITLLGNVKFIDVCKHLPNIDRLLTFDVQQFQKDGEELSILDIYRYFDRLIDELQKEKFDELINLSHSKLTAAISRLLGIRHVRGFYSTEDGYRVINGRWLIYFSAFLAFRSYNTFNLVDIYQLGGGVTPKGRGLFLNTKEPQKAAASLLADVGIKDGEKVIGLQAGSSLKERRWPPEKFAAAADMVSRKLGAKVLLFGTESEKELGEAVASHMEERSISFLGKSSLEELIGLVKRCDILLTNDTGTMHIAAAVGTPLVALFLVHAFGVETGPSSEGNIVIEPEIECFPCSHNSKCPHYACLNHVTPEDVAAAADIALGFSQGKSTPLPAGSFAMSRPLISRFDEAGFLDFQPLIKRELKEEDIFSRIYRYFFVSSAVKGLDDSYWVDTLKKNYLQWDAEKVLEWVRAEKETFSKLAVLANSGLKLAGEMELDYKKGKIEKVKKRSGDIAGIDREIEIMGNAHPELKPIVRLFELGKENLTGDNPVMMLSKTKILYKGILSGTAFMQTLLDKWPI